MVADIVVPIVIAAGIGLLLLWLLRLGTIRAGLAYYPPALVLILGALASAFLGAAVANIVFQLAPAFILHALLFGAGLLCAYGALDTGTYRLRWDASGFRIRRFARKPLDAAWSQVIGLRWLTISEFRIDLDHSERRKAHVPSYLIGSREFIAALRQYAARKS